MTPTGTVDGLLTFELELGEPLPTGQMDRERLKLRLAVNGQTYSSDGRTGWFEDEMLDLQGRLLPGTFMKVCINCAFSDYSPCGHALFGGLACFRGNGHRLGLRSADLAQRLSRLGPHPVAVIGQRLRRRQRGVGRSGADRARRFRRVGVRV